MFLSFLWACALLCAVSPGETVFRGLRTLRRKAPLVKQRALVCSNLISCTGPKEN